MLDVTSSASLVIRELIAGSNSTGGAGLRIAPAEEPAGAFSLSVAPGPEQDDQVVAIQDGEDSTWTTIAGVEEPALEKRMTPFGP